MAKKKKKTNNNPEALTHLTRIMVKMIALKEEKNFEIMMEQFIQLETSPHIQKASQIKQNKLCLAGHFVVRRQSMKD